MSISKRLSVILPVYNVEAYLEKCIRSLEEQDIPRNAYEIIVVNDGSPDSSRAVVLRLMQEFSNIVFIDQENKGVSLARNAGIDKAQGDYLLFIDPDDYVSPNSFARVLDTASHHQAQIVFLGYRFLNVDGSTRNEILNTNERGRVFPGTEAYHLSRGDGKTDPDRSVGILYDRSFMSRFNLRYVANVPYLEDGEFIAKVLCLAEKCAFDGNSFYQRTTRPGSATNSSLFSSERAINGFIMAVRNLKNFRERSGLTDQQRNFLNQPICKFILLVVIPFCSISRIRQFNASVKRLKEAGLGKCDLRNCNNHYRIEGWLYNVSPYLFFLHRLFRLPLLKIFRV